MKLCSTRRLAWFVMIVMSLAIACSYMSVAQGSPGISETGKCLFYTEEIPTEINTYLEESAETLAESMIVSLGLSEATIEFGHVISVFGTDSLYYVPVFIGQEIVYLLSVDTQGGTITACYGKWDCLGLDLLTEGKYYLYSDEDGVYLIGERQSRVLYRFGQSDAIPKYNPQLVSNCAAVDVNGRVIQNRVSGNSTKSILSKELSAVPGVGNVRYTCWAACAASICQYYGNSTVTGNYAHTYAHGTTHTRQNCPGATLAVSYSVIHNLTGKIGTYNDSTRLNAANVMAAINQSKPVVAGWHPVYGIGHEMIFTGYQFNNTTGAFTYTMMDPDSTSVSNRVYLTATYSSATPNYHGKEWTEAYYDWK